MDGRVCEPCQTGTISSVAGSLSCSWCPLGQEAVDGGTRCRLCAPGWYNDMSYATDFRCVRVDAGCFSPSAGASNACPQVCGTGYYSEGGAVGCKHCAASVTPYYGGALPVGRWVGNQVRTSNLNLSPRQYSAHCNCAAGFTGWVCDEQSCPARIPGFSLGSMLITADSTLSQYARSFDSMSSDERNIASAFFRRMLTVEIDINGDGSISRREMLDALRYRTISVDGVLASDDSFNLWCSHGRANEGTCYATSVSVKVMADDGVRNFFESAKHRFDGSGEPLLSAVSATYPNPSMSEKMCKDYDAEISRLENSPVASMTAEWTLSPAGVAQGGNLRLCGYDTGLLHPRFDTRLADFTTRLIRGSDKTLEISTPFWSVPKKSIYCVFVNSASATYECTTGLFYVSVLSLTAV